MPSTWDETIPLLGKVGDYAVIARRKGEDWFVAGITDWSERTLTVKFDFLKDQKYNAEIFTDGINANRIGNDYNHSVKQISKGDTLEIPMARGGGFAIKLSPLK